MRFRVLGPVHAQDGERPLPLGAPKQRSLLAVLLLSRGAVVPRTRLVDALWGADPPATAVSSLQVYVHGLRRALGPTRIETEGAGYRIRLEDAELDLDRFDRHVAGGRRALESGDPEEAAEELRRALALWAGPALGDLPPDSPLAVEAEHLEEQRLAAEELRGDAELACGRHDRLVGDLERMIAEHPYRERLREQQILALYRSGRQQEALDAYRATRRLLGDELGLEPGPALQELERAILKHDPSLAAPAQPIRIGSRLPAPPTPLVGRRLEVAAVLALFRDEGARLVTLTGPGGTGKTRLALAVAEELGAELRDGALFADLAPLTDTELVAPAIAEVVGAQEDERPVVEAVAEHIGPRRLLLVLDNFERLLPASPVVAELLAAAPRLLVLATSRAPLRLSAEHEYPVPPLSAPGAQLPFEKLVGNDAVRLFAARARAIDPSFRLTDENAAAVAHICRRLDGLPLAIELAAGRTRLLPAQAVADRLGRALDVLVGGPRDLPPRHQALRTTLDWSHESLTEFERALFGRLAVFSGGCTLEAADAVCGENGNPLLEPLSTLVEANLVLRRNAGAGAPRFAMLETIREYALERLAESGVEHAARERHCRYYAGLAEERYETLVSGASGEDAYTLFEAEHDNFRAALDWAADAGEVELGVRLARALRQFWIVRGFLGEGRRVFERAIADTAGAEPALHASALMHGAQFPYRQGDVVRAKEWWEDALRLMRDLGDASGVARCAGELGGVAFSEGDLDLSTHWYQEARMRFDDLGDRLRSAICSANLGEIAAMRGELEDAIRYGEEALSAQREVGDADGVAVSLHGLARARLRAGDRARAGVHFAEGLETARRLGYREVIANCVEGAAELVLADAEPERAARLLAAARRLLDEIGVRLQGLEGEDYQRTTEALRERLGPERVDEIVRETAAAPFDEDVVEDALDVLRQAMGKHGQSPGDCP